MDVSVITASVGQKRTLSAQGTVAKAAAAAGQQSTANRTKRRAGAAAAAAAGAIRKALCQIKY